MEPLLSLAYSMHHTPKAYAFLLGSGVSRAAQIPTGWEILLDLVRQLAELSGADRPEDPVTWYRETYGVPPEYSAVLERLGQTPTERQLIIRRYVDPTPEESEQGLKTPTRAHQALARLARDGRIWVIVTTNFDRLMERALDAEGVAYHVLSSADDVMGAVPMTIAPLVVLKVNGDYLDARIRNTAGELDHYEPAIETFLDRLFDEHGLIVCGWSAEWDLGLKSAISRCPSRRFSSYWCYRPGGVSQSAEDLVERRAFTRVEIAGADAFFENLEAALNAVADTERPHPQSVSAAVAAVKRLMTEDRHRIRLDDYLREETAALVATLTRTRVGHDQRLSAEQVAIEATRLVGLSERFLAVLAAGCYFGTESQRGLWKRAVEQLFLSFREPVGTFYSDLVALSGLPALMGLYVGGIACLLRADLKMLAQLFGVHAHGQNGRPVPALSSRYVYDRSYGTALRPQRVTPVSDYLFDVVRPMLLPYAPDDGDYARNFNQLECYLAVQSAMAAGRDWAPIGRFVWNDRAMWDEIRSEAEQYVHEWGPIRAGLFGGDVAQFTAVHATLTRLLDGVQ